MHEATGVYDDRPINALTPDQFEKLWKGIQKFEGYVVGNIIEVHCITAVKKVGKEWYQFCLDDKKWITHDDCVALAKQKIVALQLCTSKNGNQFLHAPTNSDFQRRLEDLPCKKN